MRVNNKDFPQRAVAKWEKGYYAASWGKAVIYVAKMERETLPEKRSQDIYGWR